jgi:hypothetical protein
MLWKASPTSPLKIAVLCVGILLAGAVSASADAGRFHDPNEAGIDDSIDVQAASYGHSASGSLIHVVKVYGTLPDPLTLGSPIIPFDTDDDGVREYSAWPAPDQRKGGALFSAETGGRNRPLKVVRQDDHRVKFVIPVAKIGSPPAYGWRVQSSDATHDDFAPEFGWAPHVLSP